MTILDKLARAVRDPFTHFMLIGLMVFAAYWMLADPPAKNTNVIQVTPADLGRLSEQFKAVWRRPPTDQERVGLVNEFVKDEVYYREALALGLDRNDTMVRRLMRQKMEFLGDSAVGILRPEEKVLRDYMASHADRFTAPAQASFRQVFLGNASAERIASVKVALEAGGDPVTLGERTLLPTSMKMAGADTADRTFGAGFFQKLTGQPKGQWSGPVQSSFGLHLVSLEAYEPGGLVDLEAVRSQVEQAWRRDEAIRLRNAQYDILSKNYRIILPDAK